MIHMLSSMVLLSPAAVFAKKKTVSNVKKVEQKEEAKIAEQHKDKNSKHDEAKKVESREEKKVEQRVDNGFMSWYTKKYAEWKNLYAKNYPAFIRNLVNLDSLREEFVAKHPKTFEAYKKQLEKVVATIEAHKNAKGLTKSFKLAPYSAANALLVANFTKIKSLEVADKANREVSDLVSGVKDVASDVASNTKELAGETFSAVGLEGKKDGMDSPSIAKSSKGKQLEEKISESSEDNFLVDMDVDNIF